MIENDSRAIYLRPRTTKSDLGLCETDTQKTLVTLSHNVLIKFRYDNSGMGMVI